MKFLLWILKSLIALPVSFLAALIFLGTIYTLRGDDLESKSNELNVIEWIFISLSAVFALWISTKRWIPQKSKKHKEKRLETPTPIPNSTKKRTPQKQQSALGSASVRSARIANRNRASKIFAVFLVISGVAISIGGVLIVINTETQFDKFPGWVIIAIGIMVGFCGPLHLFYATSNACPECKSFWAKKEVSRKQKGIETKYREEDQVVYTHKDNRGNVTGVTEQRVKVPITIKVFETENVCKYCGHNWKATAKE